MNSLFRAGASRVEKAFTLFIFFSMLFFIYGLITSISPSELVRNITIPTSLALTFIYYLPLILDRKSSNQRSTLSIPKKAFFYFGLLGFCYSMSFTVIAHSIPIAFTKIYGNPHEFEAVIEKKSSHAKGCRKKVEIKEFGYGFNHDICITSSQWNQLNAGDRVNAYSLKSVLGIKVMSLKAKR